MSFSIGFRFESTFHNTLIDSVHWTVFRFLCCTGLKIVKIAPFPTGCTCGVYPSVHFASKGLQTVSSIISVLKDERYDSNVCCTCHDQNALIAVQLLGIDKRPSRSPDFNTIGNANRGPRLVCDIWVSHLGKRDHRNTIWRRVVWYRRFGETCNRHLMTEGRPVWSVINFSRFLELEWISVDSNQATGLAIRGLIPGKSKEYFCFSERPVRMWGLFTLFLNGFQILFPRGLSSRGVRLIAYLHLVPSLTLRLLMPYIYIYIYIWNTYSWCF